MKKNANEFELTPLVESTEKLAVRRIFRCPTKVKESAEDSRQWQDSGQPRSSGDNSQPREASSDSNNKVWKLEESHPRFGPLYSVDQPSVEATKAKAWDHVLKNSPEGDPSVIKEIYLKAIRKVEQEAKDVYGDKVSFIGSNFRWMMIKDGCFFLQLALLILGCSEQLGYPPNDPIFGKKHNKKDIRKWIEAMFFVGNQIPLVVLKALMNQTFFQQVIKKGKWDPPPSGLCKKVLFELLVLPALKRNSSNAVDKQQPSDILHGLQNLVIGPSPPQDHQYISGGYELDDDIDLEADEEDIGDYDGILFTGAMDDDNETSPSDNVDRMRKFLNAIGFRSAIDDRKRIFPCATELKQSGISIKKLKGGGVRNIDFKSYYFWAFLCLPVFPVDDNAEMMFQNLKTYEISQQLGKHNRQGSSYFRFMSDIIQTTRDVKLLVKKGIIQGSSDDAEKLPRILNRLSSADQDVRLSHEFRVLRRKIRDYSSPWIHYKGVVNLVVFLTLLQTFFALLAYFKPPKP